MVYCFSDYVSISRPSLPLYHTQSIASLLCDAESAFLWLLHCIVRYRVFLTGNKYVLMRHTHTHTLLSFNPLFFFIFPRK